MTAEAADVVIVGGAVTGSSTAYHLASDPAFNGRVLVLEQDQSYQRCATTLSAGSIRQQFSSAINIEISLYGIDFIRRMGDELAVDGDRPDIGFREGGYLFLATLPGRPVLAENHALQTKLGADILFLDPDGLAARFPWLAVSDLAAGTWGRSGEGWFDGYGLLQAFRRKARSLGVEYRTAKVAGLEVESGRVIGVQLDDGSRIGCGAVVNAAGTGAARLAASAGLDLPVGCRKRFVFTFDCKTPIANCPLVIDPTGVYWRPEGQGFICGTSPAPENDPDVEDFEVDWSLFDETIWPVLAERVPAFEQIKPGRAWAGHYDLNPFDHNVFVGRAPGYKNFYLANGFSGHGLQQSPAIGRGLTELIVHGRYQSLDLSPLGYERFLENRPLIEKNVV